MVRALNDGYRRAIREASSSGQPSPLERIIPNEDAALSIASKTTNLATEDCAAPYFATMFGYERVLNRLLDIGANPYAAAGWLGMTPLLAAAYSGRLSTVRVLIERKAARIDESSPFRIDHSGGPGPSFPYPSGWQTAIFWAAREGHEDVVRFLPEHGASVNTRSYGGITALGMAKLMNRESIIRLLISNGATD